MSEEEINIMDGIKCQVFLSLETLVHYKNAKKGKTAGRLSLFTLGNFLDECVESFYRDHHGKENSSTSGEP